MKKIIILCMAALLVAASAAAKIADSQRFAALDIDVGARAVGMGSAFTGIANDASAIYWNPAGLTNAKMIELNLAYDKWLFDSSFQYANAALPIGYGTLAAEFMYVDFGSFEKRDGAGIDLNRTLNSSNISGGLGWGLPVTDFLSAGIVAKFANLAIDTEDITGALFDLGLLMKAGDIFSFGLAAQNVDPGSGTVMPENIRLGVGANILNNDTNAVIADIDVKYSDYYGAALSAGAEYTLTKMFAFRLGYKYRGQNSLTGGISGLTAGVGVIIDKISFDYAFSTSGDLGMTHLASLKLVTESPEQKEKQNYQKLSEFLAYQYFRDGQDLFDAGDYAGALEKWKQAKDMSPDYAGIDDAIAKAGRMKQGIGGVQKAQKTFDQGMEFYSNFQYDKAAAKWAEVKKINPDFKDIDTWLDDALELKASKGMSKQAEKYFREGLKYYNDCDYANAVKSWQAGIEKDPNNHKIKQYIDRTRVKQAQIQEGLAKAKLDVAKDASVAEGIKKLRSISLVCPAYKDAADILATLKELISLKTKDYYYKGIEKYTDGNLDAAIVYWKNIEELDPKSDYVLKVKRYIEDARSKQKAIQGFEKKNSGAKSE